MTKAATYRDISRRNRRTGLQTARNSRGVFQKALSRLVGCTPDIFRAGDLVGDRLGKVDLPHALTQAQDVNIKCRRSEALGCAVCSCVVTTY